MAQVCPISLHRVDTNMVRLISAQVVLFSILLLITQETILAMILLFDFLIRALRMFHLSPFRLVANSILTGWNIAPKLCDESPKRFALYLGLAISVVLVVSYMAGFILFATILTNILLFCALLETLFDFCIGCKIYYAIQIGKGFLYHDRNL